MILNWQELQVDLSKYERLLLISRRAALGPIAPLLHVMPRRCRLALLIGEGRRAP
jgi:hypothetical protein